MTNNINVLNNSSTPAGFHSMVQQMKQMKNQTQYQQVVGKTVFTPNVPPGKFYAVSTDATYEQNVTTKNGKSNRVALTFTVYVPVSGLPEKEVELRQLYYQSTSSKSPYVWQLSALLGYDSKQGFHISDLMGVPCVIEVQHAQKDDGNTYAEIVSIQRLELDSIPQNITI